MSDLDRIQSHAQIGDHSEFVQLCDKAIAIWEKKRDANIEARLLKRLNKRQALVVKRNNSLLAKLGLRKKLIMDYSITHYVNVFMDIWRRQLVEDRHWYYETPHQFVDAANKPDWWIETDYYTVYNMYSQAASGVAWIDKVREIRKVANDPNVAQLYVDGELYEFIMNWASKNV